MGSSSPPLGLQRLVQHCPGVWLSHVVQSCPDELLAPAGLYREAAREILHLVVASWSEPVQLWAIPLVLAGGKLRLVQWWHQPRPPLLAVTSVPKPHASSLCLWHRRLVSPKGFCPCRAAWSNVQRPTPALPGGPLGSADRREARPTLCTRYWECPSAQG